MLADTFSSIVIVLGAIVIHFTKWTVIDPILSIGIALIIIRWGWELFKDSGNILLESVPKGMDTAEISRVLMQEVPLIDQITDLHIWVITSRMYSMTAHIKLKQDLPRQEVKDILARIKQIVDDRFDIGHTTIEID